MRHSKLNYVLVGIFVIAMLGALLVSIATLTGRTGDTEPYFATYSNVSGVLPGTKVLYEGFQVGQVADIEPVRKENETLFRVWMAVREGWPIPADSEARIAASGLLSAVAVDIKGGTSEQMVPPGGEIPAGKGGNLFAVMADVANQVAELGQTGLKPLLSNLNTQIDLVGELLRERAPELMANLVAVSDDLAKKTPAFTDNAVALSEQLAERTPRIMDNVEGMTGELNEAGASVNKVLRPENIETIDATIANVHLTSEQFAAMASDLRETRARLDRILVDLNALVAGNADELEGTLQDLRATTATVARSVGAISSDLEGAARNLNEFTREVRRNPGRLLRSGTQPEKTPGR